MLFFSNFKTLMVLWTLYLSHGGRKACSGFITFFFLIVVFTPARITVESMDNIRTTC